MEDVKNHKVVCFGEVLWDILPSGPVPGGAPMNVTYHLHKQQKNPALITRIGLDDKGKELTGFIYSGGGNFNNGYAYVALDNKAGLIDKSGKLALPVEYSSVGTVYKNMVLAVKAAGVAKYSIK